ncbi:MAG: 2Fe-2S iron-sulfur cluster binding domain-containing protein, partial [Gallionella sp.]|nr:2Fe-2S iron-sulfur cluster binding domain-containing protein [Gallionella sp.]
MTSVKAGKTKKTSASQAEGKKELAVQNLITVYILGKAYEVPSDATIMGAIEYAGHQIIRGAGCREGYCGACATIY